jgi:hypothetical protein
MVTFADVVDWVDGMLDARAAAEVEAAVTADPELAAAAAWLRSFRSATSGRRLESPPPEVRELLMRRFYLYRPPPPTLRDRVRAAVAFDSATATAFGVRSAAGVTTRHLVLESPALDIALDLYPEDRDIRIEGQLLPLDAAAPAIGTVRLSAAGDLRVAGSDEAGRFALEPVRPGPARLTVEFGGVTLEADLDLQA